MDEEVKVEGEVVETPVTENTEAEVETTEAPTEESTPEVDAQ